MFDDLAVFFYENAVAAFTDYSKIKRDGSYGRSKDVRTAIDAATALYHLREHIPAQYRKSRSGVAKLCPNYDLLGDVVNAAKHDDLTHGGPQINSAEDIYEMTVITRYEDQEGEYSDAEKMVMVTLKDGSERDLLEVLTNVMNFWGGELESYGVIKGFKAFPLPKPPGSSFIKRADAKTQLDVEMTRGLRFKHRMKLQKYDATKGKSAPIDLTGANLRYRIYRPSYSLDVVLKNQDGKEIKATFDLTEEESLKWHSLKSEEERREFRRTVIEDKKQYLQQLISDSTSPCKIE
jgi:hypothetical protein